MCERYRLSRRKQVIEEYFGSAPVGRRLEPALQHRTHAASPGCPPAPEGTDPAAFADEMGVDPILGIVAIWRGKHDQCTVGNRSHSHLSSFSSQFCLIAVSHRRRAILARYYSELLSGPIIPDAQEQTWYESVCPRLCKLRSDIMPALPFMSPAYFRRQI